MLSLNRSKHEVRRGERRTTRLTAPSMVKSGLVVTALLGSTLFSESPAAAQTPEVAAPMQAAPTQAPQLPTSIPQPPSTGQPAQDSTASADTQGGQWTYTSQYGWLWMPYAASYTAVTPDAGTAYEYVYEPTYGWQWVTAPWILGWGPSPYWGSLGMGRFAWHAHPWFGAGGVHVAPGWGGFRGGGVYGGGFHGGGYGGGFHGGGYGGGFHGGGFHGGGYGGGFHGGGFHGGGRR